MEQGGLEAECFEAGREVVTNAGCMVSVVAKEVWGNDGNEQSMASRCISSTRSFFEMK